MKEFGALQSSPNCGGRSSQLTGQVYPSGFACPHGSHGIWAALSPGLGTNPAGKDPKMSPPLLHPLLNPRDSVLPAGNHGHFQAQKSSKPGVSLQAALNPPKFHKFPPCLLQQNLCRVFHPFSCFSIPLSREVKLQQQLCRCLLG